VKMDKYPDSEGEDTEYAPGYRQSEHDTTYLAENSAGYQCPSTCLNPATEDWVVDENDVIGSTRKELQKQCNRRICAECTFCRALDKKDDDKDAEDTDSLAYKYTYEGMVITLENRDDCRDKKKLSKFPDRQACQLCLQGKETTRVISDKAKGKCEVLPPRHVVEHTKKIPTVVKMDRYPDGEGNPHRLQDAIDDYAAAKTKTSSYYYCPATCCNPATEDWEVDENDVKGSWRKEMQKQCHRSICAECTFCRALGKKEGNEDDKETVSLAYKYTYEGTVITSDNGYDCGDKKMMKFPDRQACRLCLPGKEITGLAVKPKGTCEVLPPRYVFEYTKRNPRYPNSEDIIIDLMAKPPFNGCLHYKMSSANKKACNQCISGGPDSMTGNARMKKKCVTK